MYVERTEMTDPILIIVLQVKPKRYLTSCKALLLGKIIPPKKFMHFVKSFNFKNVKHVQVAVSCGNFSAYICIYVCTYGERTSGQGKIRMYVCRNLETDQPLHF
jgi:hypothetical protein